MHTVRKKQIFNSLFYFNLNKKNFYIINSLEINASYLNTLNAAIHFGRNNRNHSYLRAIICIY